MCADAATAAAARRDTAARGREGPIRIGGRRSERGETLSTHDIPAGTPDADDATDVNDTVETETEFAAHAVEIDHSTSGAPEVETAEELAARAPVTESNPLFRSLGVRAETVEALESVGITRAFAIQELTLPIALGGSDVIGQARTGTGKTLGFGIPILQRVLGPSEGADGVPQALVVVPTRELCVQVTRDIEAAGRTRNVRVMSVYGGRAYEPQIKTLQDGVDVVVGTPGRLIDLAERGDLVLGKVRILVLDEADEMLDLGFLPDIEKILKMIPDQRQTMLFSATMPGPIVTLARQFMKQPVHIRAEEPDEGRTVPEVDQFIYRAHALDKIEMLARLLQARERGLVMVFCRTKRTAQKVSDELADRGFASAAVHGDLGQGAREQALRAFRAGKVDVLVATDVAARGIDVTGVTHVVNYQCPEEEKTYLHRIGRTGRAGASGVAVTFVDWDDVPRWQLINKTLDLPYTDPPETYSTSEHLYADLDIPASAGGTLPRSQRTRAGLGAEVVEDLGETGKNRRGAAPKAADRAADKTAAGDSAGTRTRGRRAEGDAEGSTRPPRTRRRTRGGATGDAATTEAAPAETTPSAEGETGSGTPRRRRRRGGRGRGAAGGEAPAAEASPES
jgi:superfamily II DNA/RNA helicase